MRYKVLNLILATFQTSHTLGFTLYLLARNPKIQKRLQDEVDLVLGDGKDPITENHLARLSYLKACIKEALRYDEFVNFGSIENFPCKGTPY